MILKELPASFRSDNAAGEEQRVHESRTAMPLDALRDAKQLTQVQMAQLLKISQGAVSKVERRTDMFVSTLRNYVRAIGGDLEIRAVLFPSELAMPPACSIKGKFAARARVTGNLGIYQLQGCRSYAGLTRPDRWFCSEEDARAAGFRRAFNCRPGRGQ